MKTTRHTSALMSKVRSLFLCWLIFCLSVRSLNHSPWFIQALRHGRRQPLESRLNCCVRSLLPSQSLVVSKRLQKSAKWGTCLTVELTRQFNQSYVPGLRDLWRKRGAGTQKELSVCWTIGDLGLIRERGPGRTPELVQAFVRVCQVTLCVASDLTCLCLRVKNRAIG